MAVLVSDREGNPLHLGGSTHGVSSAQRRALVARDKGCRFPGCGARRYLHAHHIKHWIDGGPTCVSNLVLLCSRHHHLVHEGGFGVSGTHANLRFTRPDGTVIADPTPSAADSAAGIEERNAQLGLSITADTAGSRSNGERYDKYCVSDFLWCLLHPDHMLGPNPIPMTTAA